LRDKESVKTGQRSKRWPQLSAKKAIEAARRASSIPDIGAKKARFVRINPPNHHFFLYPKIQAIICN